MSLERFASDDCRWLKQEGESAGLVLSSRIRLARNIKGIPFSHWASSSDLQKVIDLIAQVLQECSSTRHLELIRLDELTSIDRQFLLERYLITREMAAGESFRMVAVSEDETLSIMVNEEDHLRLQALHPGLELSHVWERINEIDDQLSEHLDFAFSHRWGYLTACPTNVGTGIRCSVMIHLPALVIAKQMDQVIAAANQLGLTIRGMQGEGSSISGSMIQLSNQVTLGVSEEESIQKLEKMTRQIIANELEAQRQLINEARPFVEDKVFRAYSLLRGARIMSSKEAVELVSALRFGRTSGILTDVTYETMNKLMICSGPAHLQRIAGTTLNARDRDIMRARFIREHLN